MLLTTTVVVLALIATCTSLVLLARLRETERVLERTQSRMARLDEVADGLADLEYAATHEEARTRLDTPVTESSRESGQFAAIGLQFDTEDVFDDELDFAPPQMASKVTGDRRQKPSRVRHKTPAGSPKTFAPRSADSVVEVGSIQVRSDELT